MIDVRPLSTEPITTGRLRLATPRMQTMTGLRQPPVPMAKPSMSLLQWTEEYRLIADKPMRIPGPLRQIYADNSRKIVIMKGAQLGFSEWAINKMFWCAETGYAGRGTALYVQPGGENVGDFVQGRVNPAIQSSPHVASLVRPTGSTRDPDKVGLRRIGRGYTYWRTARSRSGLKSVPVDILILDEYDEMPLGTYSLAEKRLGSSTDPQIILISTPTYPGSGIEPEYLLGTQYEYFITCSYCGTEQALEWEKNVDLDRNMRVCVACRESIEDDIWAAWNMYEGRWIAKNPQGLFPSYHLSQLYRSDLDLVSIAVDLDSSDISKRQEAVNQNLGLPFAPPGNQLSLEELRRAALVTVSIHNLSGRPGCWLGVDIGSRLHCVITHDDIQGELSDRPARVLVGAFEVDNFADLDFVMRRYSVNMAVLDAHPELHSAHEFAMKYQGAVYLCNYQMGQMPPAFWAKEGIDAKRWYKVNVDRTAAIDVTFGAIRDTVIRFPYDAETVPGLFAHLMAPVRTLTPDKDGNPRATYVEGAKADHYAHAMVYSELAAYIARATPRQGVLRVREMSALPDYEGDPLYVPVF